MDSHNQQWEEVIVGASYEHEFLKVYNQL